MFAVAAEYSTRTEYFTRKEYWMHEECLPWLPRSYTHAKTHTDMSPHTYSPPAPRTDMSTTPTAPLCREHALTRIDTHTHTHTHTPCARTCMRALAARTYMHTLERTSMHVYKDRYTYIM
jgi:hypothetical protein